MDVKRKVTMATATLTVAYFDAGRFGLLYRPSVRVVLHHGRLTIAAMAPQTGALFFNLRAWNLPAPFRPFSTVGPR